MNSIPDLESGAAWVLVNVPDYREMRLVVKLKPIDEKSNNVIGVKLCSRGV